MNPARLNILLVDPDADRATALRDHLRAALPCRVRPTASGERALRLERLGRFQLCLASAGNGDPSCTAWLAGFRAVNACPVIVLDGEHLARDRIIGLMRLGAVDAVTWPQDREYLTACVERIAHDARRRRRLARRQRRLRRTVSRILHERRDLHERMDLICRDIVQAYRRLAEKVTRENLIPRGVTE